MKFLTPRWAIEWVQIIRDEGIKSFIRKKGWRVLVALIVFYAIRDGILYILIPYLAVTHFGGC